MQRTRVCGEVPEVQRFVSTHRTVQRWTYRRVPALARLRPKVAGVYIFIKHHQKRNPFFGYFFVKFSLNPYISIQWKKPLKGLWLVIFGNNYLAQPFRPHRHKIYQCLSSKIPFGVQLGLDILQHILYIDISTYIIYIPIIIFQISTKKKGLGKTQIKKVFFNVWTTKRGGRAGLKQPNH